MEMHTRVAVHRNLSIATAHASCWMGCAMKRIFGGWRSPSWFPRLFSTQTADVSSRHAGTMSDVPKVSRPRLFLPFPNCQVVPCTLHRRRIYRHGGRAAKARPISWPIFRWAGRPLTCASCPGWIVTATFSLCPKTFKSLGGTWRIVYRSFHTTLNWFVDGSRPFCRPL